MVKGKKNANPPEAFRLYVESVITTFLNTEDSRGLQFSCSSSKEQKYVLQEANRHGLVGISERIDDRSWRVTINRMEVSTILVKEATLSLTPAARTHLKDLFREGCVKTGKKETKRNKKTKKKNDCPPEKTEDSFQHGRDSWMPRIPPAVNNKIFSNFRSRLPIHSMRDTIIHTIIDNQVTVISGPTGSGKSTQVPQYLLEYHQDMKRACRIIVTQPRRISAVTVSERVALERLEKLGNTIGYQIRLDKQVSPETIVTFCTVGVLLRKLLIGYGALSSVTHVIVDEVHERDKLTDFLLLVLKEALAKYRFLRLVLISATADTDQLSNNFNNCPVISTFSVPVKWFKVKEYYLEDVLKMIDYMTPEMQKKKKQLEKLKRKKSATGGANDINTSIKDSTQSTGGCKEMDEALFEAWASGSPPVFNQIISMIKSEKVSVDYQHCETEVTPLMVAVARGNTDAVEQLLVLGASLTIRASNSSTVLDLANEFNQTEIHQLLRQQILCEGKVDTNFEEAEEDDELLELYYSCYGYGNTNVKLIVSLISYLHSDLNKGAILVFLPGYEEITAVRRALLLEEEKLSLKGEILIFMLHSNMQTEDQKLAFKPAAAGCRKVILSTNIAETSATISDVVYVIDTGSVKQKFYNSLTGVDQLCTIMASKSCCEQRKGRTGRTQPGFCYRLFSTSCYAAMSAHRSPEILHVPIVDLCLFSKYLAPANTSIAGFLSKAITPPPSLITRSAVTLLKNINALDTWEDVTDLGHLLLKLPVQPKYGKMLIYALILKCLDPVLTIVCCLSYRDLFVLPNDSEKKTSAAKVRLQFSAESLSDHMTLLRVFQGWQKARWQGTDEAFCRDHFISGSIMEIIMGIREQLFAQLTSPGFISANGPGYNPVNANSDNWAVVKAAIVGGLYPNVARLDRDHSVLKTHKVAEVGIHQTSVLREGSTKGSGKGSPLQSLPTDWLVYEEITRSGRSCYIRTATVVSPVTIAIFAGPSEIPVNTFSETHCGMIEDIGAELSAQLKLDDFIMFKMDPGSAELVLRLRSQWHALINKKLTFFDDVDTIDDIVRVLSSEEQAVKLKQPAGVGQTPYRINSHAPSTVAGIPSREHVEPSSVSSKKRPKLAYPSPKKHNRGYPDSGRMSKAEVLKAFRHHRSGAKHRPNVDQLRHARSCGCRIGDECMMCKILLGPLWFKLKDFITPLTEGDLGDCVYKQGLGHVECDVNEHDIRLL